VKYVVRGMLFLQVRCGAPHPCMGIIEMMSWRSPLNNCLGIVPPTFPAWTHCQDARLCRSSVQGAEGAGCHAGEPSTCG
jgi:hypothetical protein